MKIQSNKRSALKSHNSHSLFLIKLCHDSTEQIYYAYSCFKLSPMYICTVDSLSLSLLDNAIHWINLYTVDSAIVFPTAYPALDSDLSGEWCYPTFQQLQLRPGVWKSPIYVTSQRPRRWEKSKWVITILKLIIIIMKILCNTNQKKNNPVLIP